jgi:hypothetical protein
VDRGFEVDRVERSHVHGIKPGRSLDRCVRDGVKVQAGEHAVRCRGVLLASREAA